MSSQTERLYYPNPDEDFILRGGKPHFYRETPGYVKNSLLTDTTENLSQHVYHAARYGDNPQLGASLRHLSRSLNRVHDDVTKSLLEDNNNSRPYIGHRYSQATLNEVLRDSMNRNPPPSHLLSHIDWYTKPIHLSTDVNIPMSIDDALASQFFPVTLGQSKSLEMLEDVKPAKSSSSPKNSKRCRRSKSAQSRRGDTRTMENTFYLTSEGPAIKNASIVFTSPYSEELSKLRMEKLRIEEKQYLELKRQAELEKIRGPKPKWYSIKGPEFHIEAKKNMELLRNSDKWDELLNYRERLTNATSRLQMALQDLEIPAY